MSGLKSLIVSFLIGGIIIAILNFVANLDNSILADIIITPLGLILIYFLTAEKSVGYAENYFYFTLILATATMVFYLLSIHTKMDKNLVLSIVLGIWVVVILIKYFVQSSDDKKKD